MASYVIGSSPKSTSRKSTPSSIQAIDPRDDDGKTPKGSFKRPNVPKPLQTTNLSNLQPARSFGKVPSPQPELDDMLTRLRLNDSRKTTPTEHVNVQAASDSAALDKLVSSLNTANQTLKQQEADLKTDSDLGSARTIDRSSSGSMYTPASDVFEARSSTTDAEIARVKTELEAAKSLISQQAFELEQTRAMRQKLEYSADSHDTGFQQDESHFDSMPKQVYPYYADDEHVLMLSSALNVTARPFMSGRSSWPHEESYTGVLPNSSSGSDSLGRGRSAQSIDFVDSVDLSSRREHRGNAADARGLYDHQMSFNPTVGGPRAYSGTATAPSTATVTTALGELPQFATAGARRSNFGQLRAGASFGPASTFGDSLSPINTGFATSPMGQYAPDNMSGLSQSMFNTRSYGLPTSPMTDMPLSAGANLATGFPSNATGQTYVTPLEPMNYRRLLDKSVSCDWKYIVDKIVCNNDQQASIFLQQKLKVGTVEQKFEIVEAIINQAYTLMINRFGNFLVQRCFEHGTPEQIIAIADAIHGNVISLSMDPFGCHVIQKAFDSVPESHKADMVRELLRRIPDTVIHRYACHVWQKLFELRWSSEPPQIMAKVNDALRGMWHEVALGETGSLVVQNIFENCVEEEKRPAIEEVITNIDLIAHGQFGNWCIQHLCEHGSPPDKRRVIDHILINAYSYSIDQYASKVVEKCLKIGGVEFLDRYLTVITTAHPDRPRIPLIDIAGDQYGNYLIQWILMNTHQQQREQVAIHIRKHMVSLRGSKFGSRVAMLCCNPASATRPGPGAVVNPFGAPGQPRTQYNRYR